MTAAETRAAMTKWKVPVKYYAGWESRGRRAFGDVHGIVIHHTGSDSQSDDYLDFLFKVGRPGEGIPAPLCNVSTDMDGDVWIGAALVANHAGAGSQATMNHVIGEDYKGYSQELSPGPDNLSGNFSNGSYYGNEVRFDGGQPMTAKQWNAAVLWAAAICDHYGWSALSIIGHREHSRRKPDPGSTKMYEFRAAVAARLKAGPPGTVTKPPATQPPATTPEESTLSAADVNELKLFIEQREQAYAAFLVLNKDQTIMPALARIEAKIDVLITAQGLENQAETAQSQALQDIKGATTDIKTAVQLIVDQAPKA
jgi:hypothetical protein